MGEVRQGGREFSSSSMLESVNQSFVVRPIPCLGS